MKKVFLFGILPLLLIGGTVVGLAVVNVIQIPGISSTPKKPHAADVPATVAETLPATTAKPLVSNNIKPASLTKAKSPKIDPDQGAQRLASLWNGVDSEHLVKVLAKWKDTDIARIFIKMDDDKVADVLGKLDAGRAAKISSLIEKLASVEKPVKKAI